MKFSELGLHPVVMAGVEASGFEECTPIQEKAIPHILEGRDLAGLAQTGTGKTAAFVLPLIDRIVRSREVASSSEAANLPEAAGPSETSIPPEAAGPSETSIPPEAAGPSETSIPSEAASRPIFKNWRKSQFILVLVPTRELAEQVYENVSKFGRSAQVDAVAVYGGTGYETQKAAIRKGVEFIVATPGRLIDLYKEHQLDLGQVRAIVFDEADRMFDMGFKDDMKYILRRVPRERQFLVFSATLNFDVLNTAYEFGADPAEINVSRDQAKAENVKDEIFHVGQGEKPQFLLSILRKHNPKQTIIFSNFKHHVDRIAKFLSQNGVPAMGISSLISQSQRTRIMELFRAENNDRNVLVATDVAARGLDIKGVDMVINFELPDDAENYVHRIGRTGRAGAKGMAYSLVSDRDVEALQRIESYLGHKVEIGWLDDADIVKEFKEFPREDSRPRRDFSREGSAGGRPQRPSFKRQGSGGPSSRHRQSDDRRDRPPRGGDHLRGGSLSPRGDQEPRQPRRDQERHGGGHGARSGQTQTHGYARGQGQGRGHGHSHGRGTGAAGGGASHRRPHASESARSSRPAQFGRGAQVAKGHSGSRGGYKHTPSSAVQAKGQKGVVSSIKGLINKLFRGEKK